MTHDFKNLILAIILSVVVLGGWQYFYEMPSRDRVIQANQMAQEAIVENQQNELSMKADQPVSDEFCPENIGKIEINTSNLLGSISLQGLRFDNLLLKKYRETISSDSALVRLFSNSAEQSYFAEFGWLNSLDNQTAPDKNSIWKCDREELTTDTPVICYWKSPQKIHYITKISIDNNYLFTVEQRVENRGDSNISVTGYGRLFKSYSEPKQFAILHEGAIGAFDDVIKEITYEDLSKDGKETFVNTRGSWAGFTDKYWLSAIVADDSVPSKTNFIASKAEKSINPHDVFNVNYITQEVTISPGQSKVRVNKLFAGAKEEKLLSQYEEKNGLVLFDRSIDFGIFYFITKPLFILISYLYLLLGNFGFAIIAVTFLIKLAMYPLANKSFASMARMKELQPRIEEIKKKCGDDKMKLNQEMMALYKKEKINPAAGCLPLLIQIPVFFSLYKVIFISLEMRHAPFYGWIHDLSVQDPTSIINLFGLLPWGTFSTLNIGLWPIIMGLTMFVQQKLSPAPTDPIQANVMKFMPLLLIFMLYSLPAGLMIYWSFSNILSIAQQYAINRSSKRRTSKA